MKIISSLITIILILFINMLSGCKQDRSTTDEHILTPAFTFGGIGVEDDAMLGGIIDFIISSKNEIVGIDFPNYQIVFFSEKGEMIRKIGKKGQGPAEFIQPFYIGQFGDTISVWDARNLRFQYFTEQGVYVKSIRPNPSIGYRPISFIKDGGFFCASNGFRSDSLVQKFDNKARQIASFGNLVSNKIEYYDFSAVRQYTKKREIPPAEKNRVLISCTSDNNLMVFHQSLPLLKKYDYLGALLFTEELQSPVFSDIKTNFFAANDTLPPNMYQSLTYWRDVTPDESGGIYILLNDKTQMNIHHYDKDGKLVERLIGPEEEISLIYFKNKKLWAYGRETLTFFAFTI